MLLAQNGFFSVPFNCRCAKYRGEFPVFTKLVPVFQALTEEEAEPST
jgi:hypothetical protein